VRRSRRAVVLSVLGVVLIAALLGFDRYGRRVYYRIHPRRITRVTEEEARRLLDEKFQQAQLHDRAVYCRDAMGESSCLHAWEDAGGDTAVPTEPPRVVASHAEAHYRWLTVCGTKANGDKYEDEFVVENPGPGPRTVFPVFWSGLRFEGVFGEQSMPTRSGQFDGTHPSLC
jgi:hypothetical protein